jgi:polysaccharide export outer membrane protein
MRILRTAALLAAGAVQPAVAQDQGAIQTTSVMEYTLRPGDVLRIQVWGQEQFSGQFQIDEAGRFQYPMLGDIDTRDLTVAQVRDTVRAGVATLFKNPFVTVTPLFRISVLGHVQAPGLYTVDPTLTTIDVVALAGGPSSSGNMNSIKVIRSGQETRVNFEQESLRGRTLREVGVRSGDQVMIPRKAFTRDDLFLLLQFAQVALSVLILINTT